MNSDYTIKKNCNIRVAQVLTEKILHDIAGLVSGINIGIEYMHHQQQPIRSQAKDILSSAQKLFYKRIKFFKELYGLASYLDEYEVVYLKSLIEDFLSEKKVKFTLINNHVIHTSYIFTKLILAYANLTEANATFIRNVVLTMHSNAFSFEVRFKPNSQKISQKMCTYGNIQEGVEKLSIINIDQYYLYNLIKQSEQKYNVNKSIQGNILTFDIKSKAC